MSVFFHTEDNNSNVGILCRDSYFPFIIEAISPIKF
jgi:hypothetical protein